MSYSKTYTGKPADVESQIMSTTASDVYQAPVSAELERSFNEHKVAATDQTDVIIYIHEPDEMTVTLSGSHSLDTNGNSGDTYTQMLISWKKTPQNTGDGQEAAV